MAIFGLVLAFFNQTALFDLIFNNQVNPVFWGVKNVPETVGSFQAWIYGVLGATVSGWGIFMAFIAHYPFKERRRWAWNCMATGFTLWFLADTAISLTFNVQFNAIFNIVLFVALGTPLLFTRKKFKYETELGNNPI